MNPIEVLHFLLPNFSEILQLVFFAIIVGMIGYTVVSTHRAARPASWERKWNRGTPDDRTDDLDLEHGSVTDLSHAVATAPEKLAEVMPGMLMVVGLLGTFIGLGLALNHASNILGQANAMSADVAANSMQNLLGLLQGLGTKFKTSTWGILGFVLLKIWSEATRFEEQRLAWVIEKVKAELERRKQSLLATENARQEALFGKIGVAANGIVGGIAEQMALLIHSDKTRQQQTFQAIEKSVGVLHADLTQVQSQSSAMTTAMTQFTESTQIVVENMAQAAQRMAAGADKVGDGANELLSAIDAFKTQFTNVLDNVRKDLGTSINQMSEQASETLERGSEQLGNATREISTALGVLSMDVKATMQEVKQSINQALDIQRKAGDEFTLSARVLNENIVATTEIVGNLGTSIEEGLGSVADANRNMRRVAESCVKTTDSMVKVSEEMEKLPGTLTLLKDIVNEQQSFLSTFKRLGASAALQEAILLELKNLQSGLISRAIAEPPQIKAA